MYSVAAILPHQPGSLDPWDQTSRLALRNKHRFDKSGHLNLDLVQIKVLSSRIWEDIIHSIVKEKMWDSFNCKLCMELQQQASIHCELFLPWSLLLLFSSAPNTPKIQTVLQWTATCFSFWGEMHPKQPPVASFLSLSPTCISSVRWNAGRKLLSHPEVKWGALLFFYFKDDNQQEESNIEGPSCLGSVCQWSQIFRV